MIQPPRHNSAIGPNRSGHWCSAAAALAYYDGYRSERLPANLLQAQRDYFGAHTFHRVDKPGQGPFHSDWLRLRKEPK